MRADCFIRPNDQGNRLTGGLRICAMRKLPVVAIRRSPLILIYVIRLDGSRKSEVLSCRPALDQEGRFAIVTNVGRGMRWTLWRRARLVVRTNGTEADAKSCGPGLPTLRPSEQNDLLATGARKPGSWGERAISVKTIAQGMPDVSAGPVVPSPCFFIARGPWVAASTRHSLRPLLYEGTTTLYHSDASASRECGSLFSSAL